MLKKIKGVVFGGLLLVASPSFCYKFQFQGKQYDLTEQHIEYISLGASVTTASFTALVGYFGNMFSGKKALALTAIPWAGYGLYKAVNYYLLNEQTKSNEKILSRIDKVIKKLYQGASSKSMMGWRMIDAGEGSHYSNALSVYQNKKQLVTDFNNDCFDKLQLKDSNGKDNIKFEFEKKEKEKLSKKSLNLLLEKNGVFQTELDELEKLIKAIDSNGILKKALLKLCEKKLDLSKPIIVLKKDEKDQDEQELRDEKDKNIDKCAIKALGYLSLRHFDKDGIKEIKSAFPAEVKKMKEEESEEVKEKDEKDKNEDADAVGKKKKEKKDWWKENSDSSLDEKCIEVYVDLVNAFARLTAIREIFVELQGKPLVKEEPKIDKNNPAQIAYNEMSGLVDKYKKFEIQLKGRMDSEGKILDLMDFNELGFDTFNTYLKLQACLKDPLLDHLQSRIISSASTAYKAIIRGMELITGITIMPVEDEDERGRQHAMGYVNSEREKVFDDQGYLAQINFQKFVKWIKVIEGFKNQLYKNINKAKAISDDSNLVPKPDSMSDRSNENLNFS